MAEQEEAFKVCGLCSQLVDEAVKLSDPLVSFLISFLGVSGTVLPTKICTECYTGVLESKKFKEKCLRTVDKLKKTQLSASMILGRSDEDVKVMKQKFKDGDTLPPTTLPQTPQTLKKASPITSKSSKKKHNQIGRRMGRRQPSGTPSVEEVVDQVIVNHGSEIETIPCSIVISEKEREAADQMLEKSRSGRVLKKNFDKMEREISPVNKRTPRQRGMRTNKINEEPTPLPAVEAIEEESNMEGDDEEIFPSMGPYQCEICQEITDTKQEFVSHIKALHKDMVDEAVLRSLESDLKKRKKKEMAADSPSPVRKSKPVKPPKPSKSSTLANGPKHKRKSLPAKRKESSPSPPPLSPSSTPTTATRTLKRSRPVKRYIEVESDDEEYVPSKSKKMKKEIGKVRREPLSPDELKILNEPADCDICGTRMARAREIPKHQESLKCRQAAFLASQQRLSEGKTKNKAEVKEMNDVVEEPEAEVIELDKSDSNESPPAPVVEPKKVGVIMKNETLLEFKNETLEKSPEKEEKPADDKTNSPVEDSDNSKFNFKASIAKRYEAEKNDGSEGPEGTKKKRRMSVYDASEFDDEEEAIKAAMQESLSTAKKDLEKDAIKDPVKDNQNQNTANNTGVGEHSPAAYIDPTPQPDVEPSPMSQNVIKPGVGIQGVPTNKNWNNSCDTSRDPAAEELAAMGVKVPPLIPMNHSTPQIDSIDAQMAALHGAGGANTPWQEFHENYFGP